MTITNPRYYHDQDGPLFGCTLDGLELYVPAEQRRSLIEQDVVHVRLHPGRTRNFSALRVGDPDRVPRKLHKGNEAESGFVHSRELANAWRQMVDLSRRGGLDSHPLYEGALPWT